MGRTCSCVNKQTPNLVINKASKINIIMTPFLRSKYEYTFIYAIYTKSTANDLHEFIHSFI